MLNAAAAVGLWVAVAWKMRRYRQRFRASGNNDRR
jgi:hypothetical protein